MKKSIQFLTILVVVFLASVTIAKSQQPIDSEIDFENKVLKAELPVLVFFSAIWNNQSKTMVPIISKINDDYKGKVLVYSLDIDKCPTIAKKYNIKSIPASVAFKGGYQQGKLLGVATYGSLLSLLGLN